MELKKAVFFLRHNNDIDHITPVVWKWVSSTEGSASVVLSNFRSFKDDFRIQFLRKQPKVEIYSRDEFLSTKGQKKKEEARRRRRRNERVNRLPRYDPRRAWRAVKRRLQSQEKLPVRKNGEENEVSSFYDTAYAQRLLNATVGSAREAVIAFDWIHVGMHRYTAFAEPITEEARRRGYPVIALPHGDEPHASTMIRRGELNYEAPSSLYSKCGSLFDHVVVPNDLCAERYRPHVSSNRLHVIGSPRYNAEWISVLDSIVPDNNLQNEGQRSNIALYLRHSGYPIFWEEVARSMEMIDQFENVKLLVVHHPRSMERKSLFEKYPKLEPGSFSENVEVTSGDEYHSSNLIRWSNLVLDLGTSAVFEAVQRGIPVFEPEYLHATHTVISKMIPTSVIICRDELYETVQKVSKKGNDEKINKKEIERFSKTVIGDKKTLNIYVKLIKEL